LGHALNEIAFLLSLFVIDTTTMVSANFAIIGVFCTENMVSIKYKYTRE